MSRDEALEAAQQADLDLIEISPNANPPVAKIIDWGKFSYQRMKQTQKNKRNSKTLELKQMRVGLKISDHDLEIKNRKVRELLEEGHKVKYTLRYKGRELAHKDIGFTLAQKIIENFDNTIVVDQQPQFAGKQLNFVIRRSSNAKTKDTQRNNETSSDQQERKSSTSKSNRKSPIAEKKRESKT
jgi:translation initiation factor IF-3